MKESFTQLCPSDIPFLMHIFEPLDEASYKEAIESTAAVGASYDAHTQTSNIPIYAGTSATYSTTGTGVAGAVDSDSKRSDG